VEYDFIKIEEKWQKIWKEKKTFNVKIDNTLPKFYVLDMFPYPSGAGLHIGHPLGYIASDIYARYKRHKGFNVLHPQGYDSFGLPTEQYAILTGQHPIETTNINIKRYREQLDKIGFSFDWSREIKTSDSGYYKWTQWIFILLFNSYYNKKKQRAESIETLISKFEINGNKNSEAYSDEEILKFDSEKWKIFSDDKKQEILLNYRLAFLSKIEVNWCEKLGTVLANDEIINGVSERGGFSVTKKKMLQWSMRIGAYAQRLIDGLESINWPDSIKEIQRNWIGKSIGASVEFKVYKSDIKIEVFTTRPDTIFGATFLTVAPEYKSVNKLITTDMAETASDYIKKSSLKSNRDRISNVKLISGVFTGSYAIHPFSKEKLPIWISDYVIGDYGTGAVMAVPCGDQRDFEFANFFKIKIINIFDEIDVSEKAYTQKDSVKLKNSSFLDGLNYNDSLKKVIEKLEEIGSGKSKINFKIRDAIFSRQRYWGEPIPIYFKNNIPYSLELSDLPLILPEVKNYLPTNEGNPPLGNAIKWAWDVDKRSVVNKDRIDNQKIFPLELNTMPGWAGSSWYFNRYMDPNNENFFVGKSALEYWEDVDLYVGGSEHATGHLLYSRFWQKFLYDRNYLTKDEYAKKLINQGMILGLSAFVFRIKGSNKYISKNLIKNNDFEQIRVDISFVNDKNELDIKKIKGWLPEFKNANFILENKKYIVGRELEKMSKSKYNIISPDNICDQYGADTLRMYEMFLGPIEQTKPWNSKGIIGVHNFLKKLWKLYHKGGVFNLSEKNPSDSSLKIFNKTIKKVTDDIESFSFNTCISSFMICVNELTLLNCNSKKILSPLLVLLSPFAPHISEELWSLMGKKESISKEKFPLCDNSFLIENIKNYPISINGKMKFKKEFSLDLSTNEIESKILEDERTVKFLKGENPKKIIIVKGKIINIVI
jgi:leucyl-tRNA synthetase